MPTQPFLSIPTCQRHAGKASHAAVKVDRVADGHPARAALEDERLQRGGGDIIRFVRHRVFFDFSSVVSFLFRQDHFQFFSFSSFTKKETRRARAPHHRLSFTASR